MDFLLAFLGAVLGGELGGGLTERIRTRRERMMTPEPAARRLRRYEQGRTVRVPVRWSLPLGRADATTGEEIDAEGGIVLVRVRVGRPPTLVGWSSPATLPDLATLLSVLRAPAPVPGPDGLVALEAPAREPVVRRGRMVLQADDLRVLLRAA